MIFRLLLSSLALLIFSFILFKTDFAYLFKEHEKIDYVLQRITMISLLASITLTFITIWTL